MNQETQPPTPAAPMPMWGIMLVGVYLAASFLVQIALLIDFWPGLGTNGEWLSTPAPRFIPSGDLTPDKRSVVIVLLAGGIGSMVHALGSFTAHVGGRRLEGSWTWWYLLRPIEGAVVALAFYLVLRGGLLANGSADSSKVQVSVYGITAIAVLVGMFSQQAVTKLKEVSETLFTKPAPPLGSTTSTKPTIIQINPSNLKVGAADRTITVVGNSFSKDSRGRVDGSERATQFRSPSRIEISLSEEDVKAAGTKILTVFNPAPGAGESAPAALTISA